MAKVARHVRMTGLVQGVFFRAWTREEAQRLGVTGWVRNCRDGSVEAHVEGDERAIAELIELMRDGPPGASVEDVQVGGAAAEEFSRFEVKH